MYPTCILIHTNALQMAMNETTHAGSHSISGEGFYLPGFTHEDLSMFRRITMLIPLLIILSLSGCFIFPHGGGWHDHDHRYSEGEYRR